MLGTSKKVTRKNRIARTRGSLVGTVSRPRLSVFRSNKYLYAQLIDDENGITLGTIDHISKEKHSKGTKSDASFELGKEIAKIAHSKKIDAVIFDKGPYKYHGRVKNFAEGAREGGLVF